MRISRRSFFGGSFLAVITAVMSFVRKAARPQAWTAAMGALAIVFSLGQCVGPILSGALSDGQAGVRSGLWLSVGILVMAAGVATFQPEPRALYPIRELLRQDPYRQGSDFIGNRTGCWGRRDCGHVVGNLENTIRAMCNPGGGE